MIEAQELEVGLLKGEKCNRGNCDGVIDEHEKDGGCSCHISPPCSYCTTDTAFCPKCSWESSEEGYTTPSLTQSQKDYYDKQNKERMQREDIFYKKYRGEVPTYKLDWISEPHTNSSMIKKGVYPKGMATETILKEIRGTFGGRFISFTDFSFVYIAYTD